MPRKKPETVQPIPDPLERYQQDLQKAEEALEKCEANVALWGLYVENWPKELGRSEIESEALKKAAQLGLKEARMDMGEAAKLIRYIQEQIKQMKRKSQQEAV